MSPDDPKRREPRAFQSFFPRPPPLPGAPRAAASPGSHEPFPEARSRPLEPLEAGDVPQSAPHTSPIVADAARAAPARAAPPHANPSHTASPHTDPARAEDARDAHGTAARRADARTANARASEARRHDARDEPSHAPHAAEPRGSAPNTFTSMLAARRDASGGAEPARATPPPAVETPRAVSDDAYASPQRWNDARPESLVICCSDGRYHPHVEEFVRTHVSERPDMLALPGGPAGVDGWLSSFDHERVLDASLRLLFESHPLSSVWLVAHEGCAFYRAKHGAIGAAALFERQCADLAIVRRRLAQRWPNVEVHGVYACVRSQRVVFERLG